jgi:hypothetical protein
VLPRIALRLSQPPQFPFPRDPPDDRGRRPDVRGRAEACPGHSPTRRNPVHVPGKSPRVCTGPLVTSRLGGRRRRGAAPSGQFRPFEPVPTTSRTALENLPRIKSPIPRAAPGLLRREVLLEGACGEVPEPPEEVQLPRGEAQIDRVGRDRARLAVVPQPLRRAESLISGLDPDGGVQFGALDPVEGGGLLHIEGRDPEVAARVCYRREARSKEVDIRWLASGEVPQFFPAELDGEAEVARANL